MRQQLGRHCLKLLRQWEREGEPGASEALAHYELQLKGINQVLKRRMREQREAQGIEKPPPMRIGMKVARLGAKVR